MATQQKLDTPGHRLQMARIAAGYRTQRALAETLGVTQSYLSRVERDAVPIDPLVSRLAPLLQTSEDYLLAREQPTTGLKLGEPGPQDLESPNMRILRMLVEEAPEAQRAKLLRFLIKQATIYTDMLLVEQTTKDEEAL